MWEVHQVQPNACRPQQQQGGPTHCAGIRKKVYAAIIGRSADAAMKLVERHFPEILNTSSDSSAPLYLCCQNFIDKARPFISVFLVCELLLFMTLCVHQSDTVVGEHQWLPGAQ